MTTTEQLDIAPTATATGRKVEFRVHGVPKPGGSKRGFVYFDKVKGKHRAALSDASGQAGKDWRGDVKHAALMAMQALPMPELLVGALRLHVTFLMPRPQSHYGKKGGVPYLKATAPRHPVSKPDSTKLLRSLEDAMTGIVWKDDAQVAVQYVERLYSDDNRPGALVCVVEICGEGDGDE